MNLTDAQKAKIAAAIASGVPASKADLLKQYALHVTLTPDFWLYANPRITAAIDSLSETEVTHLKCIPMVDDGLLVVLNAKADEDGAVEFARGDSRRTGSWYARAALAGFNISFSEERKLHLPVLDDDGASTGPREYVAIRVKQPAAKKTIARPRKNKAAKDASAQKSPQPEARAPETKA